MKNEETLNTNGKCLNIDTKVLNLLDSLFEINTSETST